MMLVEITRSGAPEPTFGISRLDPQHSSANTSIRPENDAGSPPSFAANPPTMVPSRIAMKVAPSTNAVVEGATFMAILLGTIVGGLAAKDGGDPASFSGLMLVFALLCWGSSLLIPKVGSGAPDLVISTNIIRSTTELIQHLRSDRRLWWGALVTSWFWLVG